MYIIYRVLLFIAYFGVFTHCKGGGGGGGGGYYGGSGSSCTTSDCQRRNGIIVGSIIGGIVGIIAVIFGSLFCCKCCRGRPLQKNSTFVNLALSKSLREDAYDINPFPSGIWSSRYYQHKRWHGPYKIFLGFNPQSMKLTGSGADYIGTFLIDGSYSVKTRRIGLTKKYEIGTGRSTENLGHEFVIQLTWNAYTYQFEGKWYVHTCKSRYEDKFELKFIGEKQELFPYTRL